MDFSLSEEIAGLEAELARFAERELAPGIRARERAGAPEPGVASTLDGFALSGLELPEPLGGAGIGASGKVVALEALAGGDAGLLPAADRVGPSAAAILACPDEGLAKEVAAGCIGGEARSVLVVGDAPRIAWAPGSGPPEWVWRSDGEGLTLLRAGGCAARPAPAGAFHASGGVEVDLDGADVAGGWTLDPDAGIALRGRARLWPAAVALGVAGASFAYARAYATERVVMGRAVAHHQGNAFTIAEVAAEIQAARLAVRAAAARLDAGAPGAGLSGTLAALDAIDAGERATDVGVQLLGGHGYIEDHPSEKWFREARALAGMLGGRGAAIWDAADAVLDAPDPVVP